MKGAIAVVTGAANGIGQATALRLAREGASLALLDRDAGALATLSDAMMSEGLQAATYVLDLTDRGEVERVFARIRAEQGAVEILVNNVGQAPRERAQDFPDSDPELWDFVIGVTLMTAIHCSRQVVRDMRERRSGKIVNVSSDAAFTGGLRSPEYSAAKAGVIGFTRGLARQLAPHAVNVNAVGPGPTMTDAMRALPPDLLERVRASIPMGRLGAPSDIADAICFLASNRAGFITGQTLLVNGGTVFH
jgi:acetoacetyl-CoA reductase/3-oxoacyl-[acyl-carrier protein] reductase